MCADVPKIRNYTVHTGKEHRLSYTDLQHKYAHITPQALPSLLQHALSARKASTSLSLEGDRSLLTPGTCFCVLDQAPVDVRAARHEQQQSSLQALRGMSSGSLSSCKTFHCAASMPYKNKAVSPLPGTTSTPLNSEFAMCSTRKQYVDTSWQCTV